jgi:serine protease Do
VEVADPPSLGYRLSLAAIGDRVDLSVWRDRRKLALRLPVETAPERPAASLTRLDRSSPLSGATLANLSPAFNETAGLDPFERGVAVVEVRRRSEAEAWRLQPGDVIEAVDGRKVATVAELLRRLDGDLRRLDVRRGGERFAVTADH